MSLELKFLEYHKPMLQSGNYCITASQEIAIPGEKSNQIFDSEMYFSVNGERFSLDPSAVHAMFPPAGSLGNHTNVLPHITLKRSTFPWERWANNKKHPTGDSVPWIALLLFDEEEIKSKDVVPKTITLKELTAQHPYVHYPEKGQEPDDKVTIIDVKKDLLEKVMPSYQELKLLAHVRRRSDAEGKTITELAVVVGNRLPKMNSSSTVHLVSVENRFTNNVFDYQPSKDNYIRLVSLKSWSFACTADKNETFNELVKNLNHGTLRCQLEKSNENKRINDFLARGYIPLPHSLRNGDFTYSWYHSPLTTQMVDVKFIQEDKFPEFSDAMILYHSDIGMFDMTYAAAFELGRVLALESSVFASRLYQLKHWYKTEFFSKVQVSKDKTDTIIQPKNNLQFYKLADTSCTVLKYLCNSDEFSTKIEDLLKKTNSDVLEETDFKRIVKENGLGNYESSIWEYALISRQQEVQALLVLLRWFDEIAQLKHIPFNYLVPDEKVLPTDSIRFFKIDLQWLESLFFGALSIGTPLWILEDGAEHSLEGMVRELLTPFLGEKSGFLLRSPLVSGYPDLLMDAIGEVSAANGKVTQKLSLLRMERLAPDILFCLFKGDLNTLDLYLKSEGMHFGFDSHDKQLKISFRSDAQKRVVNILNGDGGIANELKKILGLETMNSAYFGKYMVERSKIHRFVIDK